YGLFPLAGSSPDVGVVGYPLGGGLSWLARKHGLAANNVTALEIVTADGVLHRVTDRENPDLFWALRGGGGNFGVVTAIEFALFPYGAVYAGALIWPYERRLDVIAAWHAWTRRAPDEITTSLRIMHLPASDALPPYLSGRSLVVIDGAYAGNEIDGSGQIAELRALQPEIDTWAKASPAALTHVHMDPEQPTPGQGDSALLNDLDSDAVRAFADAVQPPMLVGELRHLGGALGRIPAGAGALGALRGEYALFGGGIPNGDDDALTTAL